MFRLRVSNSRIYSSRPRSPPREALLRFSSKPYTLSTYHETIHICNTAVQERYDDERRRRQRYKQSGGPEEPAGRSVRDQGWDCEKLNEYLK